MTIDSFTLHRVRLELVSPFRTSFGSQSTRDLILIEATDGDVAGWGECVAMAEPRYSPEFVDGAWQVISQFLAPALLAEVHLTAYDVQRVLAPFKGHRMAKAALEMAVLDAELRLRDQSFADFLGASGKSVPSGVSIGIMDDIESLLEVVGGFLNEGYQRIKLKIEPGWDIEPVRAVRERFGDIPLQVDANTAYSLQDAAHLARLDEFDLLLIEQPLDEEDLVQHAELAKRLRTPVCLDESITSAKAAADAIALGACTIVNIKPGRVGGYLEARRIHDLCQAHGLPVWCGGMLETGIGRAANAALAALPGFTVVGDLSASDRFYREDLTEPFVLEDGGLRVPTGAGFGVVPDAGRLAAATVETTRIDRPVSVGAGLS
ncbi:o-succinylbenzoate synthase [Microbacterium sp. NPDC089695]|uniref:o-succinylbenzoate synthase n=1 Tax=Microbacterium sp. NPDC089695 TaxID=3364198 RepID=UPI0037FFA9F0